MSPARAAAMKPSAMTESPLELYRKQFPLDLLLGRVSDFSAELLNPSLCSGGEGGGGGGGEGGGR